MVNCGSARVADESNAKLSQHHASMDDETAEIDLVSPQFWHFIKYPRLILLQLQQNLNKTHQISKKMISSLLVVAEFHYF